MHDSITKRSAYRQAAQGWQQRVKNTQVHLQHTLHESSHRGDAWRATRYSPDGGFTRLGYSPPHPHETSFRWPIPDNALCQRCLARCDAAEPRFPAHNSHNCQAAYLCCCRLGHSGGTLSELTTAYDAISGDVVKQKLEAMRQEESDKMKVYQRGNPLSQALLSGYDDTVQARQFPDGKIPMKSTIEVPDRPRSPTSPLRAAPCVMDAGSRGTMADPRMGCGRLRTTARLNSQDDPNPRSARSAPPSPISGARTSPNPLTTRPRRHLMTRPRRRNLR